MKKRIQLLAVTALASLVISTALMLYFEQDNEKIRNVGDVVWWWVVTSATVGYGDIVPVTWQGRLVGIFAIMTGFFVFANLVALAAESAHAFFERRVRGIAQVTARDHIVICEYTAVADELIQSLAKSPDLADREVVIISDLVSQNPYPQHHFVNGVPINPAILRRANVQHADYVFVFANLRFADPDVKTLHVALRVIDLNPRARVMVEMVDPNNDLLTHAPPGLMVMDSRELLRAILRDRFIDLSPWTRTPPA
jgi:voltage-gated potassium channel